MKPIDERLIEAMHRSLSDFGYPVTLGYVRDTANKLANGEKPPGGPATFIEGWLKDQARSDATS